MRAAFAGLLCTGRQSPLWGAWLLINKSGWRFSIWSSTSGPVAAPACQEVCGELGWRSVGTTSPASRCAEGRSRWAIWWLPGTGWRLVSACVHVCVETTDWTVWWWKTTCLGQFLISFMCGRWQPSSTAWYRAYHWQNIFPFHNLTGLPFIKCIIHSFFYLNIYSLFNSALRQFIESFLPRPIRYFKVLYFCPSSCFWFAYTLKMFPSENYSSCRPRCFHEGFSGWDKESEYFCPFRQAGLFICCRMFQEETSCCSQRCVLEIAKFTGTCGNTSTSLTLCYIFFIFCVLCSHLVASYNI